MRLKSPFIYPKLSGHRQTNTHTVHTSNSTSPHVQQQQGPLSFSSVSRSSFWMENQGYRNVKSCWMQPMVAPGGDWTSTSCRQQKHHQSHAIDIWRSATLSKYHIIYMWLVAEFDHNSVVILPHLKMSTQCPYRPDTSLHMTTFPRPSPCLNTASNKRCGIRGYQCLSLWNPFSSDITDHVCSDYSVYSKSQLANSLVALVFQKQNKDFTFAGSS